MALEQKKIKQLRTIGHQLNPIVTIAENGVSENILSELNRALTDHELIKIKLQSDDREYRQALCQEVLEKTKAELVQQIGKTLLLYRLAKKTNKKLSNLHRLL